MLVAFSDEELCVVLDDELDSTFLDELDLSSAELYSSLSSTAALVVGVLQAQSEMTTRLENIKNGIFI